MSGRAFVTADTHFGHTAALKQFDRPFSDVASMDQAIVTAINQSVGPDDVLYHLGDFVGPVEGGAKTNHAQLIREQIQCKRIILVRGNHDPIGDENFDCLFESMHDVLSMKGWQSGDQVGNERLVMCHYAMRIWQGRHNGSVHLYGHTHGTLEEVGRSTDVGVDCWGMSPQPLEDILTMLRERPVDLQKKRPRVQPVRGC